VRQHLVLGRGEEELVPCRDPVDVSQFGLGVGVYGTAAGDLRTAP
jgi:hypothetical protein